MQIVAEIEAPHPSKTIEVPHPYKADAPTTIDVTLHMTTKVPTMDDMKITPLVETQVIDCSVLTGYADHVAFRLQQGDIFIRYAGET